jgi:hypothetical protein
MGVFPRIKPAKKPRIGLYSIGLAQYLNQPEGPAHSMSEKADQRRGTILVQREYSASSLFMVSLGAKRLCRDLCTCRRRRYCR